MYAIEPLIITFQENNWTHPLINEIVEEYKEEDQPNRSCEVWMGPLVRIYLEQDGKHVYTVCRFIDKDMYENHLKYSYEKFNEEHYEKERAQQIFYEMVSFLLTALQEDVWMPGNEQFCFSDFGKRLNDYFDFNSPFSIPLMSPDVGIHDEGDYWLWST